MTMENSNVLHQDCNFKVVCEPFVPLPCHLHIGMTWLDAQEKMMGQKGIISVGTSPIIIIEKFLGILVICVNLE
jgi:hypothetical protein